MTLAESETHYSHTPFQFFSLPNRQFLQRLARKGKIPDFIERALFIC